MGFHRAPKTHRLHFTDDLAGLEVTAKSLSLGEFLNMAEMSESSDVEEVRTLFTTLASSVVYWNLEDADGAPVPLTADGLLTQDQDLVKAVVRAWLTAMAGVPAPLGPESNGGAPSLAQSITMATL